MRKTCLLLLLAGARAIAQSNGLLVGLITTTSGEALGKTRIVLIDERAGVHRETTTDELGIFAFGLLPAGEYSLGPVHHRTSRTTVSRILLQPGEKRACRLVWNIDRD